MTTRRHEMQRLFVAYHQSYKQSMCQYATRISCSGATDKCTAICNANNCTNIICCAKRSAVTVCPTKSYFYDPAATYCAAHKEICLKCDTTYICGATTTIQQLSHNCRSCAYNSYIAVYIVRNSASVDIPREVWQIIFELTISYI